MIDKTKPGLVALYNIQPWNAAGLFLQPRSPHGAYTAKMWQGEMSTSVPGTGNAESPWVTFLAYYWCTWRNV